MSVAKVADALATLTRLDDVLGFITSLRADVASETAPDNIQELVQTREQARLAGKYSEADGLRKQIEEAGYTLEDTAAGPRVHKR